MSDGMERYLEIWGIYAQRGVDGLAECVAQDAVFEDFEEVPGAQTWHGRDGLRAVFARWEADFEDFAFEPRGEPQQLAESDFAIPVLVRGTGRTSGIDVAWDLILVTRLRDGLVSHLLFTTSPEEARERLGGAAADPVSDAAEGAG